MSYFLVAFALLASLGVSVAQAQIGAAPSVLGTLILSPNQRRDLEALRPVPADANDRTPNTLGPAPLTNRGLERADLPDAEVINGVVIRSAQHSTVWVNGQPQYGHATAEPLRALSGQARDALPPGAIRIIPPKAGVTANKESHN
jgi:hypothetical protein